MTPPDASSNGDQRGVALRASGHPLGDAPPRTVAGLVAGVRHARPEDPPEYWLQMPDPTVVAVTEADSIAPIMAVTSTWGDVFDITVITAITAEGGMAIARRAMAK